ncbi:hypothetical protein MRB53_039359 [Persea americana]|nr:hypothetical protein MRB53_039359 [Persea americana]
MGFTDRFKNAFKLIQTFNPPGVPTPPPSYHQVAVTRVPTEGGRIITIAGQVGIDANGQVPDSFQTQVDFAYYNLSNALTAAGASLKDVVHVRHYIVVNTGNEKLDQLDLIDRGWQQKWIDMMDRQAEGHRPPDTVLGVAGLAKKSLLYEVECWAVIRVVGTT